MKTRVVIGELKIPWMEELFIPPFDFNFNKLIIKYYYSPFIEGRGAFFHQIKKSE